MFSLFMFICICKIWTDWVGMSGVDRNGIKMFPLLCFVIYIAYFIMYSMYCIFNANVGTFYANVNQRYVDMNGWIMLFSFILHTYIHIYYLDSIHSALVQIYLGSSERNLFRCGSDSVLAHVPFLFLRKVIQIRSCTIF